MPTLDDLNDIKAKLLSLGDEPGILAVKGETPVDIGPPETGISEDLNALFDNFSDIDDTDINSEPDSPPDSLVSESDEIIEEAGDEIFEDFDLDLYDESVFDMDGFDAPEETGLGIDEAKSEIPEDNEEELDFEEENFSLEDLDPGDMDNAPDQDFGEEDFSLDKGMDLDEGAEDLGFEELVGITDNEELQNPDLSDSELVDFDLADEDELTFDDMETGELELGDDLDLSSSEDFDLGDEDGLSFDDTDSDDIDLSGEDLDFDEAEAFNSTDSDDLGLDEFEISDESFDEDLEIDEFDLGDLGQDFGVLEADHSSDSKEELELDGDSDVEEEFEEEEFELSAEAFERIKTTLKNLPRNLKIIIEELIGEKGLKGPSLKKLIDALAEGKTPREIASITSKIVGEKIKIPANYEKRTGEEFEEEKDSFQYTLIHSILPLLKIFLISAIIIAGISFGMYNFMYRPIHAYIIYNRGYEQLEESNYNRSAELFDQAFEKYKIKKQFYRYAEGYIESNQWEFARTQYDKLLFNYPFDKKGTIDYASMEFEKLSDYEHSSKILNNYLAEDKYNRDYEALLLLGDIYLEWGWENKDKYEDARLAFAKIMSTHGLENKILFRMLRYFIRTDNAEEVEKLKIRFEMDKDQEIDPLAYAELAGYQIDRRDISDVQDLLFRAKNVDASIPEIHYQLARLFNMSNEGEEEDKALIKTLSSLENIQTLNRRKREIKIDTYRRQGERFYVKEEYLQSEEAYNKAIDLLEESRERNIIKGKSNIYGELYSDLGHIYYYISENPENALSFYEKAENEGFYSPEVFYNKGNIRYRGSEFRQALLEFYNSAGPFSVNTNLLYATANTLFQRNDYFAAQGYYNHLLDLLEMKISREFSIRINERQDHRLMVESLMKAYNNMGVTLYGLFERTGDPSKFTAAMLNFTRSNEYFDDLTRDPETLNRTDMINLASLNQRKMLYPIPDYELQIFADISKYLVPR